MKTQARIRRTKVLVIRLGAVGTECVKNLVLGGINSIEILDDSVVRDVDFASQFFLPNGDAIIGKLKLPLVEDKIKELNPAVHLTINTSQVDPLLTEATYLKQFDVIVATEISKEQIMKLSKTTRELNLPLYVTGMHGTYGYLFVDLIEHISQKTFGESTVSRKANTELTKSKTIVDVKRNQKEKTDLVTIKDVYPPIHEIFTSKNINKDVKRKFMQNYCGPLLSTLALFNIPKPTNPEDVIDLELLKTEALKICNNLEIPEKWLEEEEYIRDFSQQAFTEYSPTAAILGGAVAQEVILYLGKEESPVNNVMTLDTLRARMPIYQS